MLSIFSHYSFQLFFRHDYIFFSDVLLPSSNSFFPPSFLHFSHIPLLLFFTPLYFLSPYTLPFLSPYPLLVFHFLHPLSSPFLSPLLFHVRSTKIERKLKTYTLSEGKIEALSPTCGGGHDQEMPPCHPSPFTRHPACLGHVCLYSKELCVGMSVARSQVINICSYCHSGSQHVGLRENLVCVSLGVRSSTHLASTSLQCCF